LREQGFDRFAQRFFKLLDVGVSQTLKLFSYSLVVGALLGAWYVWFAGRSALCPCGSHRDILALPRLRG